MWCPYCGYEMREGYVRLRGQWASWAGVLAVNFEAGDGSGEGSELLPRTLFRSHPRAAHCCVRCEAVLVEPKSGTYVPPSDAAPAESASAVSAADSAAEPAGPASGEAEPEPETSTSTEVAGSGDGDRNGRAPDG